MWKIGNRRIYLLSSMLLLLVLAGCQDSMLRPTAPVAKAAIHATQYLPDSGGMPIGSFVLKGSSVVVHRDPSAAAIGVGRLFGGVGTAVALGSADSNAKNTAPSVKGLASIDLPLLATNLLKAKGGQNGLGQYLFYESRPKNTPRYEVGSYLFVQVAEEDKVQISVITRVSKLDRQGSEGWVGQYIRHIPRLYRVSDFHSDVMDVKRMEKSVGAAMQLSFDVMVADLNGELGQAVEPNIKISSPDVLWLSYGEWSGSFVGRLESSYNIVRSNCTSGDSACFGLHILDFNQARIQRYSVGG